MMHDNRFYPRFDFCSVLRGVEQSRNHYLKICVNITSVQVATVVGHKNVCGPTQWSEAADNRMIVAGDHPYCTTFLIPHITILAKYIPFLIL